MSVAEHEEDEPDDFIGLCQIHGEYRAWRGCMGCMEDAADHAVQERLERKGEG